MKRFGIVSYNIYCNFTNYGSALQSWALYTASNRLSRGRWETRLMDYCPDILADKDPTNPIAKMWDTSSESRLMCELSLPAIRENFRKFSNFYQTRFNKTAPATSANFAQITANEKLDGFICGSDTIFCFNEFGFDDGYYANYPCMQHRSVAYAASFGDPIFGPGDEEKLVTRLQNFRAIGLREEQMLPYVQEHTNVPVARVIDPTLLLTAADYDQLASGHQNSDRYLLLYSRRHNQQMEEYAEKLAAQLGLKIIEISLRAINADRHQMAYDAGVEEFLYLVKHADYVVTNSFHGMIFAVQYKRPFVIFSREQCNNKITELLNLFSLPDHLLTTGRESVSHNIDYLAVHTRIAKARTSALSFLEQELSTFIGD